MIFPDSFMIEIPFVQFAFVCFAVYLMDMTIAMCKTSEEAKPKTFVFRHEKVIP